jgi:hypothetical protein
LRPRLSRIGRRARVSRRIASIPAVPGKTPGEQG